MSDPDVESTRPSKSGGSDESVRPRESDRSGRPDNADRYTRGLQLMTEIQGEEATAKILAGLGAVGPDLGRYVLEAVSPTSTVGPDSRSPSGN